MGLSRTEKEQEVAAFKARCEEADTLIVVHNNGLTVSEVTELRNELRKEGASFKVTKNTLVRLALKDSKFEGLSGLFTGPTAVASSADPMAAARVTYNFSKKHEKLVIVGGANSNQVLDLDTIKYLATLPSLDALRGKIIGILQAPGAQLARLANAYATKDAEAN